VSHSRVASERDVGLADASKLRRKRRGMRPEEIQKSFATLVVAALPERARGKPVEVWFQML